MATTKRTVDVALATSGIDAAGRPQRTPLVTDDAGNAVAVTYTLNDWFGAKVVAGGTGVLLNDEMDDFTAKPGVPNLYGLVQGTANAIAPKKSPLSSMSPTIVSKDGKVVMVIGSPGGSRIITITLEAILNVIDHGMTIQEAIDAPRIHHQWLPDTVYLEPYALSRDTMRDLAGMGYGFKRLQGAAGHVGLGRGHPGRRPAARRRRPGAQQAAGGRALLRRQRQPRAGGGRHRLLSRGAALRAAARPA